MCGHFDMVQCGAVMPLAEASATFSPLVLGFALKSVLVSSFLNSPLVLSASARTEFRFTRLVRVLVDAFWD